MKHVHVCNHTVSIIHVYHFRPSNHGKSKISIAADYAIGKIRQISSTADIQNTALNMLKTDSEDVQL